MVNIAVMGCGNIAHRVAKGIQFCTDCNLVGFASNSLEKAKEYAQQYGAEIYGDYDRILNDKSVDAVYICTYNQSHYDLIKTSLKHGKHVICEKPMLADTDELNELFDLAESKGLVLMEALKSVFLPVNVKIKEMIDNGEIGEVKYITASFSRNEFDRSPQWTKDEKYGGVLKDLGTYCVGTMNYFMGKKPNSSVIEKSEVPVTFAHGLLDYGTAQGYFQVSNTMDGENALKIYGDKGQIVEKDFWKSSYAVCSKEDTINPINCQMLSDFYYEVKHFVNLIENGAKGSDVMSRQASLDIMSVTLK